MRFIGVTRVSTEEQGRSGLSLESQSETLRAACLARGWVLLHVEQDVASGRKRAKRPGLDRALAACRAGQADGIIAAKLDRLSRSMIDFANLVAEANAGGFTIATADGEWDLTTANGRLVMDLLVRLSQWEAEVISERTKAALAVARCRTPEELARLGKRLPGRPSLVPREVQERILHEHQAGASLAAISRSLNADGVPPPVAGRWYATSVSRLIERATRG